jgi:hypothetical protein
VTDYRRSALVAASDQRKAFYRDYAAECRLAFDEFLKVEFTRDEAFMLVERLLDGSGVNCDAST